LSITAEKKTRTWSARGVRTRTNISRFSMACGLRKATREPAPGADGFTMPTVLILNTVQTAVRKWTEVRKVEYLKINSVDRTDVLIRADSIKCVLQTKNGSMVYIDGDIAIETGASFDTLADVLTKEE
jgi:hypothetical protein